MYNAQDMLIPRKIGNNVYLTLHRWVLLVAQTVKDPPTMQESQVQSLGWEDPLEKGMDTPSSILAWGIPWTEEPGRLQSTGLQRVRPDLATKRQQQIL